MMRTRWLGVGLAMLLGGLARSQEHKVLFTAAVSVPEAEVRSGPSSKPQMYETSRLRKGDKVEVVREMEGGWLAIKPPAGSFSWINSRFVKQMAPGKPMYTVIAPEGTGVPLLVGSATRADRPTVEGLRVARGQMLTSRTAMRLAEDGYWLPVEPVAEEVRYIRAESVSRNSVETTAAAPPLLPPGPDAPPGPPSPPGPFAPPSPTEAAAASAPAAAQPGVHPLWARAQQAEKAGQYDEAVRLYRQLGAETANSNHSLAMQAQNRAQWIADSLAQRQPSRTNVGRPAAAAVIPAGQVRSGAGILRRTGQSLDLKPLFRLENSRGIPLIYAAAQTGYTLAPYENQMVDLIGVRQYRNDLRADLMTVMQIEPLR